ncbi:50S ribosomal protein L25/general stress protein Ctc [Lacibacterium aquatile]|uniref:Large ribosomal subunit protein bL25 n=1 Tax=Lacibacterium aquatile TaxID=1168082 RepID=A0ABW5DJW2_9PROT
MSQVSVFNAEARDRAGKGAARAVRRAGRIPAVIYGNKQEPLMISLEPRELTKELHRGGFYSRLFDITVDGKKHRALARDVQFHPVTDVPEHVDFLRISADSTIRVNVPVHFVNQEKSPGIKKGGLLNIVLHAVELEVAAADIPDHLTVDLSKYDINASIHISMIEIPKSAKLLHAETDFTVATIVPQSGAAEA